MRYRSGTSGTERLAALDMWVIYERPSDFPDSYVARLFRITGHAEPSPLAHIAETLQEVRKAIPPGLVRIDRDPLDEPQIVEIWL